MPIASGMEQVVVMCLTHLLIEANMVDDPDSGKFSLNEATACEMTAVSDTLNDFFNTASNFT